MRKEPSTTDIVLLHGIRNTSMLKDPTLRSIDSRRAPWGTIALCLLSAGLVVLAIMNPF